MNQEHLDLTPRQGLCHHETYYQSLYYWIWNVFLALNGGGALLMVGRAMGSTSELHPEDSFGGKACFAWDKEVDMATPMEGKIVLESIHGDSSDLHQGYKYMYMRRILRKRVEFDIYAHAHLCTPNVDVYTSKGFSNMVHSVSI
jgi:hypothetical protein